jgi:nucleoid-associated protein YgaU
MRSRILIFLGFIPLCFGCAGTSPQTIQADINTGLSDLTYTAATVATVTTETSAAVNTAEASVLQSEQVIATSESVGESISEDTPVLVKAGDTLWSLCAIQYAGSGYSPGGGGFLWPLIALRNALANPNLILPGQSIRFIQASKLGTLPVTQLTAALNTAYQAPTIPAAATTSAP